ncbi:hypothetical protein PGT21_022319 [Puccinia graminis f. sp. tritici]|uniref:CFEM domain-containing protein n=1 Tax=Puccinia graminis f. sp. tritici TaxID=56615 RepID=A0A5B0MQM1_PUCGR|nr:hypothetical protein PGT21_022319 [Puccinia graminis f. sp. tritici]KAA1078832.1 hypothetical protein PGTUg99_005552 [Puccinia graminis f. sp. tritici]
MLPVCVQLLAVMAFSLIHSYSSLPGDHNESSSLNKRSMSNVQRNALPTCGEKCMVKLLSETLPCHPADSWCLCHNGPWQIKVEQCFETSCSPVDMVTSVVANQNFCGKLSQTPTKPTQSLPIDSIPPPRNKLGETTPINVAQSESSATEKPRSNVTEPLHGVSFRNQTLAPHSPFESTTSTLIINNHFLYFHFGLLLSILSLA